MTTPARLLATLLVAAVAATGCATFDTEQVASVGDASLDTADLEELVADVVSDTGLVGGDDARSAVTTFVLAELLERDLATLGAEAPAVDTSGLSPSQALSATVQQLAQAWLSLPPETLIDEQVRSLYAQGTEQSGVICPSHILVETEDEADAITAEIAEGADFASLAAERSIDPGSAQDGGALGCLSAQEFGTTFVPEFAEAGLGAEIGTPTAPFESSFGWHIILLPPADAMPVGAAVPVRVGTLADRYDVTVAPSIGEWDPTGVAVVPVG